MFNFLKKNKSEQIELKKIPQHIAFICDGNRRWAENRGLPPLAGHQAGIHPAIPGDRDTSRWSS